VIGPVINRRNERAEAVMGLGEHLEELRKRALWAVLGLLPIFLVAVYFGRDMLDVVLTPVRAALHDAGEPGAMQTTSVFEVFYNSVKIAFIATIVLGGPWVIYHLWKFVAPGLYTRERRFFYLLAPLSTILSFSALAFMYFVVMPTMLGFLVGFNAQTFKSTATTAPLAPGVTLPTIPVLTADPPDPAVGAQWVNRDSMELRISLGRDEQGNTITAGTPLSKSGALLQQFRVGETLETFITFAIGCVVAFQTPVVVLLLGWAGIVTGKGLRKYWRHVAGACSVAAAILTPSPDPASMLLLAVPMYALYELGLLLLWLLPASRVAGTKATPTNDGPADGP
jgi:sec-independent protein translocase protein TatC